MKTINVTFTDEEHGVLMKIKGKLSWHDFICDDYGGMKIKNDSFPKRK